MILLTGGLAFLAFAPWIAAAVVVLLTVVVISYRQLIKAYPSGGGDYEVARKNLGEIPGVVVASALLVDYVLTVAVSVASGVDNIISALPELNPFRVELAVGFVILIVIVNLRGVREASLAFAIPTYVFIGSVAVMIVVGLARTAAGRPARRLERRVRGAGRVAHAGGRHPARAAGVLERMLGPDRRRGGRRTACRRSASPRCATPRRRSSLMGGIAILLFSGLTALALVLGRALRREPLQPDRLRLREPAAAEPHGAGRRGDLRHGLDPVLRHPGGDGVRAAARGEHRVQRVPAARARCSPATATRPKALNTRGDRLVYSNGMIILGHRRDRRADRLSGEPDDPDPAVHHRRLRLVLARPDRHGAALAARAARHGGCCRRMPRPQASARQERRSAYSRASSSTRSARR